jgi:hypothetical protein
MALPSTGEVTTTTQVKAAPNVQGRCLADILLGAVAIKKRKSTQTSSFFIPSELYKTLFILYNSPYLAKATFRGGVVSELSAGTSALQNACFVQFGSPFR